jgi:hypothetical protein
MSWLLFAILLAIDQSARARCSDNCIARTVLHKMTRHVIDTGHLAHNLVDNALLHHLVSINLFEVVEGAMTKDVLLQNLHLHLLRHVLMFQELHRDLL